MTDWLDNDGTNPPDHWLEIPAEARVTGSGKMRGEHGRFKSMVKRLVGKSRTWACDGEYVAFRRAQANPATLARHNQFTALGNYKHVATHDGVEVYELQDNSKFKRTPMNLVAMSLPAIRRQAVLAGCARDWPLFVDILSEIASKIKGAKMTDGKTMEAGGGAARAFAESVYEDNLRYVFEWIWKRGGPLQPEIDAGVQAVRIARGDSTGRIVTMAPPVIAAPGQMRPGALRLMQRNRTGLH